MFDTEPGTHAADRANQTMNISCPWQIAAYAPGCILASGLQ